MSMALLSKLIEQAERENRELWEIILERDMDERMVSREKSLERMRSVWTDMCRASDDYDARRVSRSGLSGGDGARMREYLDGGQALTGGYVGQAMAEALSMAESNACMRCIVAAPTAGACGVLPAVMMPLRDKGLDELGVFRMLYTAAGIGQAIAENAFIAGAAGGCQAEIGTASAMAAGALVAYRGGSAAQIGHAAAIALKNLLGLVCDPVAGLVEVPCVKRNVIGTVNAISAAELALAGIESRVPVDQVISAMKDVGCRMSVELRETALGGLAATEFGESVKKRLWGTNSF
ncbi:MAG: L-serine ammonia-lyase, iron-sulfur-dependent, subunit alpha [Candidatus Heteroscillospira sp.]|jgi:L-serine dehydratase